MVPDFRLEDGVEEAEEEEKVKNRKDRKVYKKYFEVKKDIKELMEYSPEQMKNPGFLRLKNVEGNVVDAKSKVLAEKLHFWKGKRGVLKSDQMDQWVNALKTKVGGVGSRLK